MQLEASKNIKKIKNTKWKKTDVSMLKWMVVRIVHQLFPVDIYDSSSMTVNFPIRGTKPFGVKVKGSPIYDPYVWKCLLERTLVLGHQLCEVGRSVPFLATFISPVFPPGPLFAAEWTVSERPTLGSKWVSSRGPLVQ